MRDAVEKTASQVTLSLTLNGQSRRAELRPQARLSAALREDFGCEDVKSGCDAGDCGACTVLLDGAPVCACMLPAARAKGRVVETAQALAAAPDQPGALQRSFLRHGAAQCGSCTPGMLVSAEALLRRTKAPSRAEVEEAISGVLCRCTGYAKIVTAIMECHSDAPAQTPQPAAVGARIERLDGLPKVLGSDLFGADNWPEGTLLVRAIRSPFNHAAFTLGDLAAYRKSHPELRAILTAADIPGRNLHGVIPQLADQPVFAERITRFKGEAVAIIVGPRKVVEALDLADFPVTWQELDAALTVDQALAEGAAALHDSRAGNILVNGLVRRGTPETALKDAASIVEGQFSSGFVEHAYIEPEAGFARRVGERLEIAVSTQAPYMNRDDLALIMGLPVANIRILPTSVGGGFGSKLDLTVQPFIALAAWVTGAPCGMVYSRKESMQTSTKRHPSQITARIGADAEGKLLGMEFTGYFNTGAYASWGPTVANRVPVHASGPYSVPHYHAKSIAVHSHCAPAGAFRGFGVPQSSVVQESLFDELADALGHDRLEFRITNALTTGQATVTGQVFAQGVGIRACLEALRKDWATRRAACATFNAEQEASGGTLRRGVGVAGMWYGCGNTSLPNPSTIRVGLTAKGQLMLHQGAVDIGQGSNTVITQICAEALGLRVADFTLVGADTDLTPDAGKTSASRQTFVSGAAALRAGAALRAQILRRLNAGDDAQLTLSGSVIAAGDARLDLAALTDEANALGYVLMAEETYDPPTSPLDENGQGDPYAAYGWGAHLAEVEVDIELGLIRTRDLVCAHDVGRAINPTLLEGQIEGGSAQGLGFALMEEFHPGRTENLHDYLIPTVGDVPRVRSILIEDPDAHGPYGAKGIGEQVLIPTAPAILNAVRDATGARLRDLPATPDKVLRALNAVEA
ncbi:molybdopterin-dependent oxidoreductase [Pararhodobacter oceanensis]|uniref:molybdopterin-dependent oxidoreductase n=1 Tax=Pararhodobacter oceanensis TaxID=2172121 RepID=UPI003A8E06DD